MPEKINGGFYIKARAIQESKIATAPPYIREIWDWLLKECNHTDTKDVKRGECIRTFNDIQDGLCWYAGWRKEKYSKWQCEKAMAWLRTETMIATTKTTRGLRIKVLNYGFYQDPKNYESNRTATAKATGQQQSADTINKNDKNVKNDKNIYMQIEKFKKAVKDYVTENPKYHPVQFDFIKYWTEPSKSGKSFRYKDQKYFDMGKRLGTFYSNYIKKQRYNAPEEKMVEYKPLPKFKDFGEFIDYYVRFQSKGKDTLLPYPKKIKDLAYAFSHQQIRLDDAVKEWDKLRG